MKPGPFQINRRRFLKTTAAITATTGLPGWFLEQDLAPAASPKPLGPNDRPGIALVGCGGQGRGDCKTARRFGDVIAVCDVDKSHGDAAAQQFKSDEKTPAVYTDFRKLMERDDVHIIITGTPDHWHTMVNLLALKTGKDVYSEKPLTLCIDEGKRLVQAVGTGYGSAASTLSSPIPTSRSTSTSRAGSNCASGRSITVNSSTSCRCRSRRRSTWSGPARSPTPRP
jgi:hypothetical protein